MEIDDGDIIAQESFEIADSDHASDIYEKVIVAGQKIISKFFPLLVTGSAPRVRQNSHEALVFDKVDPLIQEIKPDIDSIEMMDKKIRAFSHPYNGAYIADGKKKLVIWRSEIREER